MSDLIPTDWSEKTIGDLADAVSGGTPARDVPEFWDNGSAPWVTPTDITATSGRYLSEAKESITGFGLASSGANMLPAGTVLMTSRATIGEAKIAVVPCCTNQGFKSLVPKNGTDSLFLYYLTQFHKEGLKVFGSGSTFLEIGKDDVLRFRIRSPGPAGQKQISRILNAVDSAIEQTEALIAKHQQIKAGLMFDLFTQGIPQAGSALERNATSQNSVPKGWKIGSLDDIGDHVRGCILTGPFGADLSHGDFTNEGVPVLRIGNVQAGYVDISDLLFISPRKANSLARYKIKPGDLLFARQGATTGRNALAPQLASDWIINYHIIRIAFNERLCSPVVMQAIFNSDMVKRQIERDKGRSTREGISGGQLQALVIPIPPVEQQRKMESILLAQDARIESEQAAAVALKNIRAGLMYDLLQGPNQIKPSRLNSTTG